MNKQRFTWLGAALLALAAAAQAAPPTPKNIDPLRLQYERERADCITGRSPQPREACLREAGDRSERSEQLAANALKRSEVQRGDDREICERRVREGQVTGSVQGGGRMTTLTVRSTDIPKSPGG